MFKKDLIKTSNIKVLWRLRCKLGEGVTWVKEQKSIYFVDIKKKKFFKINIKNKKKKVFKVNKEIGFLSHIKKDIFILGLQGELRIQNLKSKKILQTIKVEPNLRFNRINDGKTDQKGNLWFGTMDGRLKKINKGALYKLNKNLFLTKVDKGYETPNGPAFIDEFNFYHTDSSKKIIYKIKIDENNQIINKKIFKKFKLNEGSPDGMTLDKKKNLWVAHYQGACVSVFNSKAKLMHRIEIPAKNITNCTFGGKNLNELFITTASQNMTKNDLKKFKYSGFLLKIQTNSKGFLQKKFHINQNII